MQVEESRKRESKSLGHFPVPRGGVLPAPRTTPKTIGFEARATIPGQTATSSNSEASETGVAFQQATQTTPPSFSRLPNVCTPPPQKLALSVSPPPPPSPRHCENRIAAALRRILQVVSRDSVSLLRGGLLGFSFCFVLFLLTLFLQPVLNAFLLRRGFKWQTHKQRRVLSTTSNAKQESEREREKDQRRVVMNGVFTRDEMARRDIYVYTACQRFSAAVRHALRRRPLVAK